AAEAIDIPLSSEAARFYKSGLPFLHDYFPFWMAALLGKLIILLIPILGLLYPMMRFLPRLYTSTRQYQPRDRCSICIARTRTAQRSLHRQRCLLQQPTCPI